MNKVLTAVRADAMIEDLVNFPFVVRPLFSLRTGGGRSMTGFGMLKAM